MRGTARKLLLPALLLAAACLFGGCGSMTPEKLAGKVIQNSKDIQSLKSDMVMDFGGKVSAGELGADISMDMSMKMDLGMEITTDPEPASYLSGTMELSMFSMNVSMDMESYTVPEGDGYMTYTKVDDEWTKTAGDDSAETVGDLDQSAIFEMIQDGDVEATMFEDPGEVNGRETYVLAATISGDALESLLSLSQQAMGEDADLELDGVKADAQIHVYRDELRLAQIVLDCSEMGRALFGGSGIEDSVEVDHFDLTITVNSWNDVDPIQVPKEALSAAEEDSPDELGDLFGAAEPDGEDWSGDEDTGEGDVSDEDYELEEAQKNEDGTYTIGNYDETLSATIGITEGYEYDYSSPNYFSVSRYSDEESLSCSYSFEEFCSMEEMAGEYGDFSYMQDEGESYTDVIVQEETTLPVQGMEVRYVAASYLYDGEYPCVDCCAWAEAPGGMPFLLEIDFMGYEPDAKIDLEKTITDLFGAVTLAGVNAA